MKRLKCILAIESYIIRKGFISILNKISGIFIIEEIDDLSGLERILKQQNADLLIICSSLFNRCSALMQRDHFLLDKIIILDDVITGEALSDVKEIMHLNDSKDQIYTRIENLLSPFFRNHDDHHLFELSEREKTIVRHVAAGLTNKEIAEKLFLSVHTVITHRKNISRKLGIKSASELTVYAIVNNIIDINEITVRKNG
ncbi:MAG: response regulator transcription factor [Bacteroidales bacterium]|nr:response regulator transcription factor [Bacteroidales bacterium]MBN2699063.1 response regulator transcription factor [Bacteroidales bacterium]